MPADQMTEHKPYWSQRHGRGPMSAPLDLKEPKRLFFTVLDDLVDRGYFQEALGYDCVDGGEALGALGARPNDWFLLNLHRDTIWPYRKYGAGWDEDTLFDVIEALHDLVSEGVDGWDHTYMDCGMHYSKFDSEKGQNVYREELNPTLGRYERPLELDADGRLVEASPDEFKSLLGAEVPPGTDPKLITRPLNDAIDLFRNRSATTVDRRRAVRDLAHVLEVIRKDIKEHALPKDERELFRIANGFAIRHNNREQRRDYDDAIWLRWAFYVYLATIHAVLRLRARQQHEETSTQE